MELYDLSAAVIEIEAEVTVERDGEVVTEKVFQSAPAGTCFGGFNGEARIFDHDAGTYIRIRQTGVKYTDEAKKLFATQLIHFG